MMPGWALSNPIRWLQRILKLGRHLYWGYLFLIGWAIYQVSLFCWTHQPVARYLAQRLMKLWLKIY